MKKCRVCKQKLPASAFSLKKNSLTIFATACDVCRAKPALTWAEKNPEKIAAAGRKFRLSGGAREGKLKSRYGITEDEYSKIFSLQNGECAICSSKEPGGRYTPLHVDHCHKENKVRGLLCTNCNRGLGYFKDDPLRLRIAADYLSS